MEYGRNHMRVFKREKEQPAAARAQLRGGETHPFGQLGGYIPLHSPASTLYRSIREAVPIVDAAILKLIRLAGGVEARCPDRHAERLLNEFFSTVPTGRGQRGIQSFLDAYLDSMLTCGRAVGEMVPGRGGREIAAVLCGNIDGVEVKEGDSPLEFTLCQRRDGGLCEPLPRQELLLFTPYNPEPESPYGVSLLRSMPFLTDILLKIYQTIGVNWERAGNVRFAVIYRPPGDGLDRVRAQERSAQLAREWGRAMQQTRSGSVHDFVAVGDVDIRVIGADNQVLDCQVPVRQIMEQLIARTGIPPFLLGLSWSSTERMSTQQADMMTSEITALRRNLEPVLERIATLWLRMHGFGCSAVMEWEDINLQDEVEEAKAELYRQQARRSELENRRLEA